MHHSAIELEILSMIKRFKSWRNGHDRGVVLGLMLSCIPFPPISILGLLVGLFNLLLIQNAKLSSFEKQLVWTGIAISVINSASIIFLIIMIINGVKNLDLWGSNFFDYLERLYSLFGMPDWLHKFIDLRQQTNRVST